MESDPQPYSAESVMALVLNLSKVAPPCASSHVTNAYLSYQLAMRFGMDGNDPEDKLFQTPRIEISSFTSILVKLESVKSMVT